jgi:hypothetical protein
MATLTPQQRLNIIAELKRRGEDVSGYSVNPSPAEAFKPDTSDQQSLHDLAKEYNTKKGLSDAADKFMKLQGPGNTKQSIATGLPYRIPIVGDVARAISSVINPDQASRLQQMDAINAANWARLRPEGSGRILPLEGIGWKNAFPSAGNTLAANKGITQQFDDDTAEKLRHLSFVSNFVSSGQGHYGEAEAAYAQKFGGTPATAQNWNPMAGLGGGGAPPPQTGGGAPPTQNRPPPSGGALPGLGGGVPQGRTGDAYHPAGWTGGLPGKMQAALKLYANSTARVGDQKNPWVPQNPGQFNKVPKGDWVLDTDGTAFQKKTDPTG